MPHTHFPDIGDPNFGNNVKLYAIAMLAFFLSNFIEWLQLYLLLASAVSVTMIIFINSKKFGQRVKELRGKKEEDDQ